MIKRLALILCLSALFVACDTETTPTEVAQIQNTSTAVTAPTNPPENTQAPDNTNTPLPEDTNTPQSTQENTPNPTNTDIPRPTNTSQPTNTLQPTSTNTRRPTRRPTSTPRAELRIITTSANARSGPGTNYDIVSVLESGDTVIVLGKTNNGDWFNVLLSNGDRAWIASSVSEGVGTVDLDLVGIVSTVPVPPTQAPATNTTAPQITNTFTPEAIPEATFTLVPTNPPAPTSPPPTNPPPAVCSCSGNIYNCSDFSTHSQAQACFNYCVAQGAGDVHDLDRDNDGDACESLP